MSANFASDNTAGAHPKIVEAIARVAGGRATPYGEDELTKRVERRIADLFERDCAVFLVGTGTAANALALAAICPPHGAIYCHPGAHVANDECGAPEFYTGGAKLTPIDGADGKLAAADLARVLATAGAHGIHGVKPAAVSLSNASEAGTVYRPAELGALAAACREHGLGLHVDGARFANAVAGSNASPAALTWKSGVDVLTFGATKNGAIAAEAIVFFDAARATEFGYRRKRGGQLWSKHRFLAAQFDAYLEDDLWLATARPANAMARRLADGLAAVPGGRIMHAVEANEIFVRLPEPIIAGLERDGFVFYRWPGPMPGLLRLVTAFDTEPAQVDAFLASAARHAAGRG